MLRPLGCERLLFLRQRHAEHFDIFERGQIERQIPPAGADVENLHAGFQAELGRKQPELVALRLLQRLLGMTEIGAGVEHVLVEKQAVEIVAEIVVVRDVLLRLALAVRLLPLAEAHLDGSQQFLDRIVAERQAVHRKERQEVAQRRTFLETHRAVHIGLAGGEFGVEHQAAIELRIGQPHRDFGSRRT